jgi:trehalose 6-phosphate synthase/phosphatase
MQERLRAYDARRWASHFLSSLERVKTQQGQLATKTLTPTLVSAICEKSRLASSRLLLLDYDGTLVPFASQPQLAVPDAELYALLASLRSERTRIFLISGRDRHTLGSWFNGHGLGLIAEHGAWIREGDLDWQMTKPLTSAWKERLIPIFRTYVDQVGGSLFEEKDFSIAWHYRRCDPQLGAQRAKELIDEVTQFTANLDVQVLEGKMVVEIRNAGVNKGAAALRVTAQLNPEFILAVGDDQTDEDLFRALPETAISVRVGVPFSHARYHVNDNHDVRRLLAQLATHGVPGSAP